jgi:hypothetical protein
MAAGHNAEELEKRLVAAAILSRPAIFLDNYNGGLLKSQPLDSMITEGRAEVRPLGYTKMVQLYTTALIQVTGNATQISEDSARRLLRCELDARMESPEQRPFPGGDLIDRVMARRNKLLGACLTIWRWGIQNKKLPRGKPSGSFEQWARWCRDPLLALGCRDPADLIPEIKAADPARVKTRSVMAKWWERHKGATLAVKDLHHDVCEEIDGNSKRGGPDNALIFSRQKVQAWAVKHANTRVGSFHLQGMGEMTTPSKNKVAQYRMVNDGDEE